MMADFHTNPTQLTGLIVFALAALACARAAMPRRGAQGALWWGLAALQSAFFLEVVFGLRHRSHDAVDSVLQAHGWYASRGTLQIGLIAVALVLAGVCVVALVRLRRIDAAAMVAVIASAVALWLFVIEAISLHAVDALMYTRLGPVMRIGWVWAAASALVALAALRAARP